MTSVQTTLSHGRTPIAILGVPFDNVTTADVLDLIEQMIASGKPHYGATANVDFVVQALEDVELRRILFDAHLVMADGMPLVWASRFLGNPLPERVTGSGMIPQLLERAEQKGWKVFFLGSTEQNVAIAAQKTRAKHPKLQLVGAYSPPFKPLLEMDPADILRRLHQTKPDILLVAFGCPKQEKWITMHLAAAGVPFSVGVGATIDFLAGTFKRAPVWMQKTGTEWVFRMLQEPKRLVGRYGKDLRVFGVAILRQWWQMRGQRKPPSSGAASISMDIPGVAIIKAPSRLDAATAQGQQATWLETVTRGNVILDLGAVEFVDSTGIGLLVRLRKQARGADRALVLAAIPASLLATLKLMKLDEFFSMEAGLAAARLRARMAPSGSRLQVQSQADALVVDWQGEITASTAGSIFEKTFVRLCVEPAGAEAIIDLSRVEFVDSTGIGMMLRLKKQLWQRSLKITFRAPTAAVSNVLRMTKLESYLLGANP